MTSIRNAIVIWVYSVVFTAWLYLANAWCELIGVPLVDEDDWDDLY